MGKRDDLIAIYSTDLREACGLVPDPELLDAVVTACGPLIYGATTATVDATDRSALATIRENFLVRRLGMEDSDALTDAIDEAVETYGRDARQLHRAVLYYLLTLHFRREDALS